MDRSTEIATKTERVMRMLATENLGGVILSSQPNFSWLTAGGTSGIDSSREPGAGALLVRNDGKRFVLANRIEMVRLLAEELDANEFEPVEYSWEEEKASAAFLVDRTRALLLNNKDVGTDLPLTGGAATVEGAVARCRYSLTESEVDRFRRLGHDAGKAVGDLVRTLEPGQSEKEVARLATDALGAYGIRAVVNLVAADERISKYRHPVATDLKWQRTLMVVVCARRGGLIASLTRIVSSGPIPDELQRRTRATAAVNACILNGTRVGTTGAELYRLAAKAYATEGFEGEEHMHHQGGACGYRTRDWVAHPSSGEIVQPDQAFAWNPSITGTKVEETCILLENGLEPITSTAGWPYIETNVNGRVYLSPDVLVL